MAAEFSRFPKGGEGFYILFGAGAYLLFQFVFSKPIKTYIFGHELTHMLVSLAMGGKLKRFTVSEGGGEVQMTRINFLVRLAPYILPLYTLLVLGGWFASGGRWREGFLFLIGFTLCFHLALTMDSIRQGQTDLKESGLFFSLILILVANVTVLILVAKPLFPTEISLGRFFANGWRYGWVEPLSLFYSYLPL